MSDIRQSSFSTGEISPSLYGRTDLKQWGSALKKARNVLITSQGIPTARPGTTQVLDATTFGSAFRLIPFDYANGQNLMLVFAATKLWIVSAGTALTGLTVNGVGALTYITTPYAAADLKYLNFAQSGDVVTLSCKGYKPQDLKRLNSNNLAWSIGDSKPVALTANTILLVAQRVTGGITQGYDDANLARAWQWGVEYQYADGSRTPFVCTSPFTTIFPATGILLNTYISFGSASPVPVIALIYRGRNGVFGLVGAERVSNPYASVLNLTYTDLGAAPDFSFQPSVRPSVGWNDARSAPAWTNNTQYNIGDFVTDGGKVYRCTQTGVSVYSGGGPSLGAVQDGAPRWAPNTVYNIGDRVSYDCFRYRATAAATSLATAAAIATKYAGPNGLPTDDPGPVWVNETVSAVSNAPAMWEAVSPNVNAATPPDLKALYPYCSCYFEGRKVFGGGDGFPSRIQASKTSDFYQYEPRSLVPLATDPVIADLAAVRYDEIRAFASMRTLLAFTSWGVWTFGGVGGGALTPTSIDAHLHVQYGISWLDPVVVGNEVLYVPVTENSIRNLAYAYLQQNYEGSDLTMLARHLFEGDTVVDWCWSPIPNNVMWCVMASGKLVGLTYNKEHELRAFHWHDTGTSDKFVACASVLEGPEYAVYFVVQRTINASTKYFVERLASRVMPRTTAGTIDLTQGDKIIFSDCAKVGTNGSPITVWTNFAPHLANTAVSVLADGKIVTGVTVGATGTVTLAVAASKIVVGLPYTQDIEFLPPALPNANIRSNVKAVNRVSVEMADTQQFYAGPDTSNLRFWAAAANDLFPSSGSNLATPKTKLDHVRVPCTYDHDGTFMIRNSDPLPMTILAVSREVDIGGG